MLAPEQGGNGDLLPSFSFSSKGEGQSDLLVVGFEAAHLLSQSLTLQLQVSLAACQLVQDWAEVADVCVYVLPQPTLGLVP